MASLAALLPNLLPTSLQERRKKQQQEKLDHKPMRQRKDNVMEHQLKLQMLNAQEQLQQLQGAQPAESQLNQQLQQPSQQLPQQPQQQQQHSQLQNQQHQPQEEENKDIKIENSILRLQLQNQLQSQPPVRKKVSLNENGLKSLQHSPSPSNGSRSPISQSSSGSNLAQLQHQNGMSDAAMRKASWATSRDMSNYRNMFNCLICVEAGPPVRPRLLLCDHMFCEHCLHAYWSLLNGGGSALVGKRSVGGATSIACPICRKLTVITHDGCIGQEVAPDKADFPNLSMRKISQASDNIQRCDTCVYKRRIEAADFYCAKCSMNYCGQCRTMHDQHPLFRDHAIIHISSKDTFNLCCEVHGRQDCLYFCMDCDQPCCTVCVLLQDEHRTHNTARVRDALTLRRDLLKNILNEFAPKLDWLEAKVRRLSNMRSRDGEKRNKSESLSSFSDAQSDIITHLTRRRATDCCVKSRPDKPALVSHSLSQDEITNSVSLFDGMARSVSHDDLMMPESPPESPCQPIGTDRWLISIITAHTERIGRLFVLSTNLLETSQSKKLLAVYTDVVTRIRTVLDSEINKLQASLASVAKDAPVVKKVISSTGHDKESNLESLASESSSLWLDEIFAREAAAAASMIGRGSSNQNQFHLSSDTEGSPPYSGTASSGCRTRHGSGMSEASTVALDPDPERGRTMSSMLVKPKLLWKVERQRADQGELWNPCGAAFLPDRRGLIVAEYDVTNDKNNKLRLFDEGGKSVNILGSGQIQPLGVTVTKEGNIAVTDCKAKRVKILTLAGQTTLEIGKNQFGWPYGIATTSRNQLVVSDAFSDCISIYSIDGKRIRQFGSSGSGNSQFRNPFHIALDSKDNIYVSDSGNNCIKVFDINGRYIFSASETGIRRGSSSSSISSLAPSVCSSFSTSVLSTPNGGLLEPSSPSYDSFSYSGRASLAGVRKTSTTSSVSGRLKRRRLKNPRGVAVDQKGNILVADDCCRVCMFDGAGRYVRHLLTDEDSVKYPEVVSCSAEGQLVVTEWNPNNMFAVKVFTLYETSQSH